MTTAQDGGKTSLTQRPPLTPGNAPGTHFCYSLSLPQGHSAVGRILCQLKIPMTPAGIFFLQLLSFIHIVTLCTDIVISLDFVTFCQWEYVVTEMAIVPLIFYSKS